MAIGGDRGVVVVGASLAGSRTAMELRAAGCEGRITLIGDEVHPPYDRPPLSKQFLAGAKGPEDLQLPEASTLTDHGVDLLVGRRAVGLRDHTVCLDEGDEIPYSQLVIATGVSARVVPGEAARSGRVHVLRTLEDALRLRAALESARHLLVVGAGFVGAEVATVARQRNTDVTMVEALAEPFSGVFGAEVGRRCAQLQQDHGVVLRTSAETVGVLGGDASVGVLLRDGGVIEADCVLVAIGTTPNNGWLSAIGADGPQGVLCDSHGRVLGAPNAFAVGDVAAWRDPVDGVHRRFEHWTNATDQAHAVAATMVRGARGASAVPAPYFWSDQHGVKIQMVGHPELADRVRVRDDSDRPHGLEAIYLRRNRIVGAVAFGSPAWLARCRPLVEAGASEDEVDAVGRDRGFARR